MGQEQVKNAPVAQQDAGQLLQDLLGVTKMTGQMQAVLTSPEVTKTFAEAVGSGMKQALEDLFAKLSSLSAEESDKIVALGVAVMSNENIINTLSDGVFRGMKRMVADGEAQKGLARVCNLMVSSQEMSNVIGKAVDTAARRQREFFLSDAFKGILTGVSADAVASAQETFNTSITEAAEGIKNIKLNGSFTVDKSEE